MEVAVLFLEIRGRRCALPVPAVREVFTIADVTPVPGAPAVVRGVTPLRGQAVPLIDLGSWLGHGASDPLDPHALAKTAILIEGHAGDDAEGGETPRAALLVDRVLRVGRVDRDARLTAPGHIPFVTATVADAGAPALLLDAAAALDMVRTAVAATAKGESERSRSA